MKLIPGLATAAGMAALAAGASVLLVAPEAKAVCVTANPPCSVFDPSSTTNATFAYSGVTTTTGAPYDKVRVGFRLSSATTGLPLSIGGITLAGDGITGTQAFPGVTVAANGNPITFTSPFSITSALNTIDFGNSILNFSFPAGLSYPTALTAFVQYGNGTFDSANGDDVISRSLTTTTVPGPLPILGAASAFGFSRSMRRRIKRAKVA